MSQVYKKDTTFYPVIVGCRTLENELLATIRETGCQAPVRWIRSGLHNTPALLHDALDSVLEECRGYTHILLAMGFCGNSMAGVRTRDSMLIVPRADDCISLLLGSMHRRSELNSSGTYFFTEGWLRGERTIMVEYQHAVKRYGLEMADRIFNDMLKNYHHAALVDTGCYDMERAGEETRQIADALHLSYREIPGTLSWLKTLLTGPWTDEQFVRIPPDTVISASHLSF